MREINQEDSILFSYLFDSDGKATELATRFASQELKNKGLTWVHIDANNKNARSWIKNEVSYLDHLIIDALTAQETRPRVTEFSDGLLIILREVNQFSKDEPEDMVSIRVWIDSERIITVQRRSMHAIFDIKEQISQGKIIKTSTEFLYNLLYKIIEINSPFLYDLSDQLDVLEDQVVKSQNSQLRSEILDIRTSATIFKRYLVPQKEVIAKLRICNCEWVDDWAKRHFQENLDQITMAIEELDEIRDRSHILSDELFSALTEKLNKSMYLLSLIASIFIPLTFFTSILSVNIAGIPGANSESAFMWMIFIIAFLTLLQLIIFKRKDMF